MTAIPAQRGHRTDPVSVTDDAVEISRLRVTHPETVAIARRELAEQGPAALADTVATAVVVGMVATGLQRSTGDTTAAMERVLAGFDEAMQARAATTVAQLDGLLGRIDTTEQATREAATAALAGLPIQIERGLTAALAGGANNVQRGRPKGHRHSSGRGPRRPGTSGCSAQRAGARGRLHGESGLTHCRLAP